MMRDDVEADETSSSRIAVVVSGPFAPASVLGGRLAALVFPKVGVGLA
jgi:hypothetical protein